MHILCCCCSTLSCFTDAREFVQFLGLAECRVLRRFTLQIRREASEEEPKDFTPQEFLDYLPPHLQGMKISVVML